MIDLDALAVQVGREVARAGPGLGPGPGPVSAARAMLAKLREMGLVVEWRPIEEAPRDGTEIDIWVTGHGSRRVANCRWGRPSGANWGDRFGCDDDLPSQWITRSGTALDRRNGSATHFSKLPKGPGHD